MEEPHPGCKQPGCREVTQGGWLMHHLCIVCGEVVCAGGCALCDDDLEQDVLVWEPGQRVLCKGCYCGYVVFLWSVRRHVSEPSVTALRRPANTCVGLPVSRSLAFDVAFPPTH